MVEGSSIGGAHAAARSSSPPRTWRRSQGPRAQPTGGRRRVARTRAAPAHAVRNSVASGPARENRFSPLGHHRHAPALAPDRARAGPHPLRAACQPLRACL